MKIKQNFKTRNKRRTCTLVFPQTQIVFPFIPKEEEKTQTLSTSPSQTQTQISDFPDLQLASHNQQSHNGEIPRSGSMDNFFNELLKDTHACIHTHAATEDKNEEKRKRLRDSAMAFGHRHHMFRNQPSFLFLVWDRSKSHSSCSSFMGMVGVEIGHKV